MTSTILAHPWRSLAACLTTAAALTCIGRLLHP